MKHLKVINGKNNMKPECVWILDHCSGYDGGSCTLTDGCFTIDLGDCKPSDICGVDHCTPGKIDIPE